MPRVSVIIPARNERFLVPTIRDVLAKATGDIEVIVVLDGYWGLVDDVLPDDPRVTYLHFGDAKGMRPGINAAVSIARGAHLLKCDGHVLWAEGFDETLLAEYQDPSWVLTARRHALDPETWTIDTSNPKYPIDYHYLSYPFARPDDPTCGLHGTEWRERREARREVLLDDEMSSQGSAWFMSRAQWDRIGPLDITAYGNFVHEFQEIGLKTWLGGGAVKVTKRTHYAHLYKGRKYGRGYTMGGTNHAIGSAFCTRHWMTDAWPAATRTLQSLVEQFGPVPGWPADLDRCFAEARRRYAGA